MGAVASSRYRRVGDDPRRLLDASMYALVRGTRDENSSFRGHELLRDFYGSESFTAKVNTATFRSGNQLIDVTLKNVSLTLSGDSGFYNGQVITFVSGEAGGVSTRIVAYDGPTKTFRIVAPYIDGATKATLAVNDGVVVNGKAFSGTRRGTTRQTRQRQERRYLTPPFLLVVPLRLTFPLSFSPTCLDTRTTQNTQTVILVAEIWMSVMTRQTIKTFRLQQLSLRRPIQIFPTSCHRSIVRQ